jgi:hypothetical protein
LLFEGKYTEAQKLVQANMMGKHPNLGSYQTLGALFYLRLVLSTIPLDFIRLWYG